MGFDLYGSRTSDDDVDHDNPKKGEYFRANVWSWRPLWDLTCHIGSDVLTDEDSMKGTYNDGHFIDEKKAIALADCLSFLIKSGEHRTIVEKHNASLDALPLEECIHCGGTGKRNDEYVKGTCNACHGEGESKSVKTFYRMYTDYIEEFESFLRHCDGFSIH